MRKGLCALGVALMLAAAARADDSSAMLGAGGIVFARTTPVRMASEDLYVSPRAVRVRFAFVNPTGRDARTVVAFPLPDIDTAEFWGSPVGTLTDDPRNFVGFKVAVDGKPVAFAIDQRAVFKGKDVTAQVEAAGLPVNVTAGDGYHKLDALAPAKRKVLAAAGLVEGDADNVIPQWRVRTRFWWTQDFPARKTVVIEHSYQPVTGQSFFSPRSVARTATFNGFDYCFDKPTWAAARVLSGRADPANNGYVAAYQTGYILMTARNWTGPIGRFHLTLDKLRPDNVLSLCWGGTLKKTGPTTFEFTGRRFTPVRDIDVLVLQRAPQ